MTADPLWYKDAIIYEVHVRAFFDSDNDGIGDFRGLTQKLDYLHVVPHVKIALGRTGRSPKRGLKPGMLVGGVIDDQFDQDAEVALVCGLEKFAKVFEVAKNDQILCVANLSRFPQPVELDLSSLAGLTPVEMLGYTEFPQIDNNPYRLSLGPYGFLWFELQERQSASA